MNRYERLYAQLGLLLRREPADLEIGERLVLKANDGRGSTAMMDLVLEVLAENPKLPGTRHISLAHYFLRNGDLCADPDLLLLVHPPGSDGNASLTGTLSGFELGRVECLFFQQAIPPVFCESYDEGDLDRPNPAARRHNNSFLADFVQNHLMADLYAVVDEPPTWREG